MWYLTLFIRISVFIAKLSKRQYCWRVIKDFHSQECIQFFDVHRCLFMRPHFSIGGYDYRRTTRLCQSIHFSIIQVLFADHVHRRSAVDNKFSFLRLKIWCRQTPQFPKVRRMLLFHAPSYFRTFLDSFHAASRAPCSCSSVSSRDLSSNFGALGLRWWGSPGQMYPSEGFWSRILVWRAIAFVNFTRWIGPCMSELFHEFVEDFGCSTSWKTQSNCHVIFNIATDCTFVIILFGPFIKQIINLAMCTKALFSEFATALGLVEQAFWRVPLISEWIGASSSKVILARPSRHATTGTTTSGTSGSLWFSLILPHDRIRRRIWWWTFTTLIHIVAETAIVSFHTLPVGLPLPTISKKSSYTLFPWILDHGVSLVISVSGA